MLIVVLVPATILILLWIILMCMLNEEDWRTSGYCRLLDIDNTIKELQYKDAVNREELKKYKGVAYAFMKLFLGGGESADKKIRKLKIQREQLQSGNLSKLGILEMPGYVILRKNEKIGKGVIHRNIVKTCSELYGRQHADKKAKQILAKMLSYAIFAVAVMLSLVTWVGFNQKGLMVLLLGIPIVVLWIYSKTYSSIQEKTKKRREAIARDFPAVVSKLALLLTAGRTIESTWEDTANSRESELYQEMRVVSAEIANGVLPVEVYQKFIERCNTKETAKLASAIIQSYRNKSNLTNLLQNMSKEAWLERKHNAKRDSEKANSRLMIPTMLLFGAVMIMIMMPVFTSFSSF